jgi:3-deoxy-D-manno-octulosonate 8-phosphate phosphatase (KDO 8-P phosphatase)
MLSSKNEEKAMNELIQKAAKVKCLICDVDGVLTDGVLYLANDGNEMKAFNVQDGVGIKLLLACGIDVAVITASEIEVVDKRMQQLGISCYFKGQVDKRQAYIDLKKNLNVNDENIAYIGDDLPDLPIMKQVGFAVAPANAVHQIKEYADWVTEHSGGKGAVRELCDLILSTNDKHTSIMDKYFK